MAVTTFFKRVPSLPEPKTKCYNSYITRRNSQAMYKKRFIAVIGSSDPSPEEARLAEEIGR